MNHWKNAFGEKMESTSCSKYFRPLGGLQCCIFDHFSLNICLNKAEKEGSFMPCRGWPQINKTLGMLREVMPNVVFQRQMHAGGGP